MARVLFLVLAFHAFCNMEAFSQPPQFPQPGNTAAVVQYFDVEPGENIPPLPGRKRRSIGNCECIAEFFEDTDFRGRSLKVVEQNAHFANNFFNDRVDSIVIDGPCRWLVYVGADFVDIAGLLSPQTYSNPPSWGGSGDRISSARAIPPIGTDAICLFEDSDYEGRMLVLYGSSNSLGMLDYNDHISSVIVTGGTWTLYEDSEYRGRSTVLEKGDYPSIHGFSVGGDTVSSVRCIVGCTGSNNP